jgi:hypothetical protein
LLSVRIAAASIVMLGGPRDVSVDHPVGLAAHRAYLSLEHPGRGDLAFAPIE